MMTSAWKMVIGACLAFACLSSSHAAELLDVRFGPNGDDTRIVFDIDGDVSYTVSGDAASNGRLLVDFADLSVKSAHRDFQAGNGHVARYGFADGPGATIRAVLEFKKTAKIKEVFMLAPKGAVSKHRLVIDLITADKKAFLASLPNPYPDLTAVIEQATAEPAPMASASVAGLSPPSPTPKQASRSIPTPAKRQTIVIDAGHGGVDPGSQGQSGTLEKTVTLSAALELAEILKKRGDYEIVLTRDEDSKIKPDKREELARKADADLFISLHADAISKPAVRGASVYTLSKKGSARSAALAKSQGDYVIYDLDLQQYDNLVGEIMLDKAQDETLNASSQLAELLISNLSGKTPMLNRSHRTANLRVLLAPDVPAVLLEMAFISNVKDEANLKSPVWRKRAMGSVADAIDDYFENYADQRFASNRAGGAR